MRGSDWRVAELAAGLSPSGVRGECVSVFDGAPISRIPLSTCFIFDWPLLFLTRKPLFRGSGSQCRTCCLLKILVSAS